MKCNFNPSTFFILRIPAGCGGNECTEPRSESDICYGSDARDCVLTNWSPWTQCIQESCNSLGSQSRLRGIITEEECGGQDCANELNENTTCTKPDCGKLTLTARESILVVRI